MERSAKDRHNLQGDGFRIKITEENTLELNGMLVPVNPFVFAKILGTSRLDPVDQFLIHLEVPHGCPEFLSSDGEGIFHDRVGCPEDNERMGGTSLQYLLMGKGIAEPSPLKIDMGSDHSFQSALRLSLHESPRPFRSFKVPFELEP
jgi:hypothetical protein